MTEIPLYEGETVLLHWSTLPWECQVSRSDERCVRCGGVTVEIHPPWETWRLFCCAESAFIMTQDEHRTAMETLPPGTVGLVSSLPVRVEKKGK
jgi:hypothetical protein